jgi:hypothetical protein
MVRASGAGQVQELPAPDKAQLPSPEVTLAEGTAVKADIPSMVCVPVPASLNETLTPAKAFTLFVASLNVPAATSAAVIQ